VYMPHRGGRKGKQKAAGGRCRGVLSNRRHTGRQLRSIGKLEMVGGRDMKKREIFLRKRPHEASRSDN